MLFDTSKPFTFDRVVRIAITTCIILIFIKLIGYLGDVLIPFVIALLLAYLLNPIVNLLQKKIHNRIISAMITIFGIIGVLVFLGWLLIPVVMNEVKHTGQLVGNLINNSELASKVSVKLPENLWKFIQNSLEKTDIKDLFQSDKFYETFTKILEKILPSIWGIISGTATIISAIIGFFLVLIYLFFLLIGYEKFGIWWKELIPPAYKEPIFGFINEFDKVMNNYFRGQFIIASILSVIFATGFAILGLPLGIILGIFTGMLCMVPYMHLLGLVPAILFAIIRSAETGTQLSFLIGGVLLVFVIAQLVSDLILTPKIMGKVTGLNPALILLSISVWGRLLGFFGLIIALPITYLILAYYRRFLSKLPDHL